MRALLDVNVLIALLDSDHVHHRLASSWLEQNLEHGWASCPLTQNGCIRILSQPAYPSPLPAAHVAARLTDATVHASHDFWGDSISLLEDGRIDWRKVLGARQVTDAYLLALAVEHGGRLATFDRRIDVAAVRAAQGRHLVMIG